jgi:hypothetical protein
MVETNTLAHFDDNVATHKAAELRKKAPLTTGEQSPEALSPASDDYYDDDAWGKIRDLKDEIAEFFKARERSLMCDWETMLCALHVLSQDVYRRQRSGNIG